MMNKSYVQSTTRLSVVFIPIFPLFRLSHGKKTQELVQCEFSFCPPPPSQKKRGYDRRNGFIYVSLDESVVSFSIPLPRFLRYIQDTSNAKALR